MMLFRHRKIVMLLFCKIWHSYVSFYGKFYAASLSLHFEVITDRYSSPVWITERFLFFRKGKINVRNHGEHKQINVGCFIRLRITETRSSKSASILKVIIRYNGFMITTSKIMTIFVRILRPSLKVTMFCKGAYDLLIAFNPSNALDFFVS